MICNASQHFHSVHCCIDHIMQRTMKNFKLAVLILLGFTLALSGLTSCIPIYSNIGIPAREEFVLGEGSDGNFNVELRNKSSKTVQIRTVNQKSGEVTQTVGLEGRDVATLKVGRNETVYLSNAARRSVTVQARISKTVQGMRYQKLD